MKANYCGKHWASETHGPETVTLDNNEREVILKPEGEACSFCPDPAERRAEAPDPEPAPEPTEAVEDAASSAAGVPRTKTSKRPKAS